MSDLTEQYLNKTYEDLQRDLLFNMTLLKNRGERTPEEIKREIYIQKQIPVLNSLLATILKLRNIKLDLLKLNS